MKTNFDDILKRKLEQQHFPVDQAHRQEMIDLLNSQRRRKPLPFWWLGGIVTLVAIVGLYFYIVDHNAKPDVSAPEKIQKERTSPGEHELMAAASHEKNSLSVGNQSESIPKELNVNASASKIQTKELHDQVQSQPIVKSLDMPSTNVPSSGKLLTLNSKKTATFDQAGLSISPPIVEGQRQDGRLNDIHPVPDQSMNHNVLSFDIADRKKTDEQMPLRTIESIMGLEDAEMKGISFASENTSIHIQPAAVYKKSFYVFGVTGLGFVLGSKPDFEAGWKFRLGAGLGFNFSPKLQFTLSGGYLYQNGGFEFQRLSTVNQPGFGSRSSFNTLTPDKLHFVYTKAGVETRSHRHIFTAHAGLQLLYGAQGDITTMVNDQFLGMKELNEYTWLKTSGLRTLHWTADFAYGYQITSHLSVSVGADYYFSSFTVEDPSLESEGFTWSGAYSPFQPFINFNYLLYGRL
jgi:hypothetical protein